MERFRNLSRPLVERKQVRVKNDKKRKVKKLCLKERRDRVVEKKSNYGYSLGRVFRLGEPESDRNGIN